MAASQYTAIKSNVNFLLNDVGSFLADTTHGDGTHAASAPLNQQLTKAFEAYYTLKESMRNETIDCALMALTKSGKLQTTYHIIRLTVPSLIHCRRFHTLCSNLLQQERPHRREVYADQRSSRRRIAALK